jgi:dihydrofolate reductase
VFSRTLNPTDHPDVTVVSADVGRKVAELRAQPGRDIWLFGGGNLFASLLAASVVDQVEVALMPVLLGQGMPLLGAGAPRARLALVHSDSSKVGTVNLVYNVHPAAGQQALELAAESGYARRRSLRSRPPRDIV